MLVKMYEERRAAYWKSQEGRPEERPSASSVVNGIPLTAGQDLALFFRIVAEQETDAALRKAVRDAMHICAVTEARLLIAEGRLDEAERLLRQGAWEGSPAALQDLGALMVLRRGAMLDVEQAVTKLVFNAVQRNGALALLHRARGEWERAAAYAVKQASEGYSGEYVSLVETMRWKELGEVWKGRARGVYEPERSWVLRLSGDLAGAEAEMREQVSALKRQDSYAVGMRMFAANERVDEGIEALRRAKKDEENDGFNVLCAQWRMREALALLRGTTRVNAAAAGVLAEMGLKEAAAGVMKEVAPPLVGRNAPVRNYKWQYAAGWRLAGQEEAARGLWEEACQEATAVEGKRQAAVRAAAEQAAALEKMGPGASDADRIVARMRARQAQLSASRGVSFEGEAGIADARAAEEAAFWFEQVMAEDGVDIGERYKKVLRLMRGELKEEEWKALGPRVVKAALMSWGNEGMKEVLEKTLPRMEAAGQLEVIRKVVEECAEAGDRRVWAYWGDVLMDKKREREAVAIYREAAKEWATNGSLMYRLGLALERSGDDLQEGRRLKEYAVMLVLSDAEQARALAAAMRRFEGKGKGDGWFEGYARRFCQMPLEEIGEYLTTARDAAEARGDYAGALAEQSKLMLSRPVAVAGRPSWRADVVMLNVGAWHRLRVLEGLPRRDWKVVGEGMVGMLANGPVDVEVMEKVVPLWRAADREGAGRVVGEARRRLLEIVEDWPEAGRYKALLGRVERLGGQ